MLSRERRQRVRGRARVGGEGVGRAGVERGRAVRAECGGRVGGARTERGGRDVIAEVAGLRQQLERGVLRTSAPSSANTHTVVTAPSPR